MTRRADIIKAWETGAPCAKTYVAFCLIGCPWSDRAERLFPRLAGRRIIHVQPGSAAYHAAKRCFRQDTFPICLAVPTGIVDSIDPDRLRRPPGIVRLGGFSDVDLISSQSDRMKKSQRVAKKKKSRIVK